jgi:hypothetical protein
MRDYSQPLNREYDGTYITIAQMHFFLNRDNGRTMFEEGHQEFWDYYNLCRAYNLISEMMEDRPDCAIMYWDDKLKTVSVGYPTDGPVSKALEAMAPAGITEDLDDEDGDGSDIYNN